MTNQTVTLSNQTAGTTPSRADTAPRTGASAGASRKNQFQARIDNQKAQLERHGNFAEVVIRTTPEGTDMINFARLWEYVLVQADRQTRGYVAKSSRNDFEATRKDFEDCVDFMVQRLKGSVARHHIDLSGTNFISRVAQRYHIADKVRKPQAPKPQASAEAQQASVAQQSAAQPVMVATKTVAQPSPAPVATPIDDIDDL